MFFKFFTLFAILILILPCLKLKIGSFDKAYKFKGAFNIAEINVEYTIIGN